MARKTIVPIVTILALVALACAVITPTPQPATTTATAPGVLSGTVVWQTATSMPSLVTARPATITVTPIPIPAPTHLPLTPPTSTPVTCTVHTGLANGWLNLRAGPGDDYPVIDVLQETTPLTILEPGDWLQVRTPSGNTGWVLSRYCQKGPLTDEK